MTPLRSSSVRLAVGVGLVVSAVALGATSCGGDSASDTATPITVTATNYVTIPPTPSTAASSTTAPDAPGTILQYQSSYVIVEGDYPSTIASMYQISLDDLLTANNWTLSSNGTVPEWPGVGASIIIPAGATVPGAPASSGSSGSGETETAAPATTSAPTTTVDQCAAGTYVILPTDTARVIVAEKFDVTVEQLDAANVDTPGYSGFYPGLTIIIPAKEC